jgi:hypothetical protein
MKANQIVLNDGQLATLQEVYDIQKNVADHHKLVCGSGATALTNSLYPGEGKLTIADKRFGYVADLLHFELVVYRRVTTQTARHEVSKLGEKVLEHYLALQPVG